MITVMDEDIKRWTSRRKSALVMEIFQRKTTVAEASRAYDLPPSERLKVGWRMPAVGSKTPSVPSLRIPHQNNTRESVDVQLFLTL